MYVCVRDVFSLKRDVFSLKETYSHYLIYVYVAKSTCEPAEEAYSIDTWSPVKETYSPLKDT